MFCGGENLKEITNGLLKNNYEGSLVKKPKMRGATKRPRPATKRWRIRPQIFGVMFGGSAEAFVAEKRTLSYADRGSAGSNDADWAF